MNEAMIKAKLAELAAVAEVTRLANEQQKHWDGELKSELSRMQGIITELLNLTKKRERSQLPIVGRSEMSDAPFSVGQSVRCVDDGCVDDEGTLNEISKGTLYRVVRCAFDRGLGQWCVEIEGNPELWYAKRFVSE